ncbi:MAG: flavodoxin family protein [Ruminococcaceae bacterium]|nr:flavodoxin family protein [Oscillospiraceae bacterium]
MNTLIIHGSPRKNGGTSALVRALSGMLPGEVRIVETYRAKVAPCMDCRHCWENRGCVIEDEMQEIIAWMNEADNIVLASPIYFAELSGSLLNWASRLQYLFASARFRKDPVLRKKLRRGVLLLVDGGQGEYETAEAMGRRLLRVMGAPCGEMLYYSGTDFPGREDPLQDPAVMARLGEIAAYMTAE